MTTTHNEAKKADDKVSEQTSLLSADANGKNKNNNSVSSTHQNGNGAVNNGNAASSPSSSKDSDQDPFGRILADEIERPWPATFERSISLLSSPMINRQQADLFTKSPKLGGTPLTQRRARLTQRGYETPEQSGLLIPSGRGDYNDFQQGVKKVHSLDYASRMKPGQEFKPVAKAQLDQQRKAEEAKEYRKKLLEQKSKDEETGGKTAKKTKEAEALESRATFTQCVFNMSNILMGVGLLELPYACKQAGWFGGLFCLFCMGLVTWRTSILIGRELNGDPRPNSYFDDSPFKTPLPPGSGPHARMRVPIKSFPDIARESYGEFGCFILSIILYFELYSCVCIFFVTVGDHLHTLFPTIAKTNHLLMAGVFSCLPTVFLHNARLLSYFSMVGTLATIAVVLSVAFAAVFEGDISDEIVKQAAGGLEDDIEQEPNHILWRTSSIPVGFGLVAYCFSGHAIVPSIYSSMRRPQEFEGMITVSYVIVCGSCLLVGAAGYYMFGAQVLDQVTLSLEQHSNAVAVMKILTWLMILTALSKITLTIFPLSLGMEEIVAPYIHSDKMMGIASSIIKLLWTIVGLIVAIFVPSFSYLCTLVGLICTMSVSVIFPAAAHIKLFSSKLSSWEIALDWVFVVFGTAVAVVGTINALREDVA